MYFIVGAHTPSLLTMPTSKITSSKVKTEYKFSRNVNWETLMPPIKLGGLKVINLENKKFVLLARLFSRSLIPGMLLGRIYVYIYIYKLETHKSKDWTA